MTPQSSCKYNGHGFNDDGVCIYCHEDDGTQTKASDEMTKPNQSELDELEQRLLKDGVFQHILKFAPQSQRELMTFELARYITANYTPNSEVMRLRLEHSAKLANLDQNIELTWYHVE